MDRIFFNKMAFYAYHGAFSEENRLGQRFLVDLELMMDLKPAADTDDLDRTVNYASVYEAVKGIVEDHTFALVETLAERIADRLLTDFPLHEVMVRVTKPDPPIPGHYESVGVEIRRKRS
ncbi:dihydroneopterin aldolase [Marininema halotolerans]|uniref:7,8-dihydroneopterin aldolase n=1 Tax=Marininema halotolerans TaxID=1155944 RepID=A0A1I6TAF9_9BACL|nr:dihydroneopterin aldolase [Marininema halotolerans]SFS86189.1 dihydroneopterin aldolase [Marininema halotolerans]